MPKTKATIKLEPLGDRVIIKPIHKEEVTKRGIVLPDTARAKEETQERERDADNLDISLGC